ncbi:MAG: hypothetical protein IJB70_11470 [Clostridia bacterium]|nr:hypothetical protein [Clostridia bacterium]
MKRKCIHCNRIVISNNNQQNLVCPNCGKSNFKNVSNNKDLKIAIVVTSIILACTVFIIVLRLLGIIPFNQKDGDLSTNVTDDTPSSSILPISEDDVLSDAEFTDSSAIHGESGEPLPDVKHETPQTEPVEYNNSISDVEGMIAIIKDKYYAVQDIFDSLTLYTNGKNDIYTNADGETVVIGKPIDNTSYYGMFYYDDGELYFVFIFDGTLENRFYIYDNTIIRWIDEEGTIHDNAYDNEALVSWHRIIFE